MTNLKLKRAFGPFYLILHLYTTGVNNKSQRERGKQFVQISPEAVWMLGHSGVGCKEDHTDRQNQWQTCAGESSK